MRFWTKLLSLKQKVKQNLKIQKLNKSKFRHKKNLKNRTLFQKRNLKKRSLNQLNLKLKRNKWNQIQKFKRIPRIRTLIPIQRTKKLILRNSESKSTRKERDQPSQRVQKFKHIILVPS